MDTKLERDVKVLKTYSAVLTVVVLCCIAALCWMISERRHPGAIDVSRINVRDANGKLDMVIANTDTMPPAIVNGKEFPNGRRGPGILFYNGKGDEDGGLAFGSTMQSDGNYHADGQLMFDQYNQDQEVGILYHDDNGARIAGLKVWDRGATPLDQIMQKVEGLQGAQRAALVKQLSEAGELGTERVFVGRLRDKSAEVVLADAHGRPRLTLSVDASGSAEIRFLDENGKVVSTIPAQTGVKH